MESTLEFFKIKILSIGFLLVIFLSGLTAMLAPEQTVTFAYVIIAIGGMLGGIKILDKIKL